MVNHLRPLQLMAFFAIQLFSPTLINPKITETDSSIIAGSLIMQGLKRYR